MFFDLPRTLKKRRRRKNKQQQRQLGTNHQKTNLEGGDYIRARENEMKKIMHA